MKKTTLDELLAMANAKAVRRQPSDEEHRIQVSCVRWFRLKYPHLFARLFAVPNGGCYWCEAQSGGRNTWRGRFNSSETQPPLLWIADRNEDSQWQAE